MKNDTVAPWLAVGSFCVVGLLLPQLSAAEECCSDPGDVAACWYEDAKADGVACISDNDCLSGSCDNSQGLCSCSDVTECYDGVTRFGVCDVANGLCGPSYCNGTLVCSCWGGCIPKNYGPYGTPTQMCGDTDLGYPGYCCEGTYPSELGGGGEGFCSADEMCHAGCVVDADCRDPNPCTADTCQADGTCLHLPVADGQDTTGICTFDATYYSLDCAAPWCIAGACGVNTVSYDNLACTDKAGAAPVGADPACYTHMCAAGLCEFAAFVDGRACDDGDACLVNEVCSAVGTCGSGVARNCDDSSVCTVDSCDSASAAADPCVHTAISCDDSNACTVDTCNALTGCGYDHLAAFPVGSPCCDPGQAATFNDGNACTVDTCDATFHAQHFNVANGTSCGAANICDMAVCQVNIATGISQCSGSSIFTGTACDDVTTGQSLGYTNLYPVCGGYKCQDVAGVGTCVNQAWNAATNGLVCASDVAGDPCKTRRCNVNAGTLAYSCDYQLAAGATCVPASGPDACTTYQCSAAHVCTAVGSVLSATADAVLETCSGRSLVVPSGGTVTSSNDSACRANDYTQVRTGRFSECPNVSNYSDVVYNFAESTSTAAYQLVHRRVTVKAASVANPPGYSDITSWDPLLSVRKDTCADANTQSGCNDDCTSSFAASNLAASACTGLAAKDAAVTSGPWPLEDFPASSAVGGWNTTSQHTSYVFVDSKACTTSPPCPPGGEYNITVTEENHSNNDCRNTGAYVAAPLITGQSAWKDCFRGTTTGYTNYVFGKNAANGPSCWNGGVPTANDPKTAFFRADLAAGSDAMGANEVAWPRNYKLYVDPAASGLTNSTLAFYGSGLADGNNNCVAGLATQSACYPLTTLGATARLSHPREHLVSSTTGAAGWFAVSNYAAGASGSYELNVLRAPREFANVFQLYEGSVGGTCACNAEDNAPTDRFQLEGRRLDFLPANDQSEGFIVTNAAVVGGGWLVDPSWAVGTNGVLETETVCTGAACTSFAPGTVPREIGFAVPYSGGFWQRFCIDAAGRVELAKVDATTANGWSCANTWDRTPNSAEFTSTVDGTVGGSPYYGYAPSLAPAWGAFVPCWNNPGPVWRWFTGDGPKDSWDGAPSANSCEAGADGQIVTQLVQFEGTTARVISWDGFDTFTRPKYYRTAKTQALRFQVIIRGDGRIVFAYPMPTAIPSYQAGNLVWDKVLETNAWITGLSGTRYRGGCNGQAATYCNTSLSVSNFTCDDQSYSYNGDTIYAATYFCIRNASFQQDIDGTAGYDPVQLPAFGAAAKTWKVIP